MKKFLLFFLLLMSVGVTNVLAQCALVPVSLNSRVQTATLIAEGKVGQSWSFWDAGHKLIYTAHEITLYKVFKGSISQQHIYVITLGGKVGQQMLHADPALELETGDIGVFMLKPAAVALPAGQQLSEVYDVVTDEQGFIRYDLAASKASDIFNQYSLFSGLYQKLQSLTGAYHEIQPIQAGGKAGKGSLSVPTITSISPLNISSGTDSVITIKGTNFETTRGSGAVRFKNADNGGSSGSATIYPYHYVSWSDTQIVVKVPSQAGTGKIAVVNNSGSNVNSADTVKVTFAQLNVVYDTVTGVRMPNHRDINGTGGYVWRMNPQFAGKTPAKQAFFRALESWRCGTYMNWTVGDTSYVDEIARDNINIVKFSEMGGGKLGICYSWWSGCGTSPYRWYVAELDIEFDSTYDWNYGPGAPAFSQYDFESVAVHELGHGQQLGHVINSNEIMHYSISNGQTKRTLSANDLTGGNYVKAQSTVNQSCGPDKMIALDPAACAIVPPVARFVSSKLKVCPDESFTLTDSSKNIVVQYNWDFGTDAVPATAASKGPHNIHYTSAGVKTVQLIVTGSESDTFSLQVEVPGTPDTPGVVMGDTVTCIGQYTYRINRVEGAVKYRWYINGNGNFTGTFTDTFARINWGKLQSSNQVLVRTIGLCDTSGARSLNVRTSDSLQMEVAPFASTVFPHCVGDTGTYTVHFVTAPPSFRWKVTAGKLLGDPTDTIVSVHWNTQGMQTLSVTGYGECDSITAPVDGGHKVIAAPMINLQIQPPSGREVNMITTANEDGTVYWDFGDGQKDTIVTPASVSHTYAMAGAYKVKVILVNDCGSDSAALDINVPNNLSTGAQLDKKLKVAFMPNPAHDKVQIKLDGWKNSIVDMELYNIVGEMVHKTTLQTAAPNEITLPGLPPGVYLYKITGIQGQQSVGRFVID